MLNINAPGTWDGTWATTRLGCVGTEMPYALMLKTPRRRRPSPSAQHPLTIHLSWRVIVMREENKASLSCLAVWPQSHPFALDEDLLAHGLESTVDGWPRWLFRD